MVQPTPALAVLETAAGGVDGRGRNAYPARSPRTHPRDHPFVHERIAHSRGPCRKRPRTSRARPASAR